jgi:hypothetical protein
MLHFKQNDLNSCDVTVSNESELNNPNYLWCLTNLDSNVKKYFIPYNATVANATRFDTFTFSTNRLEPEVFTGSTCNIHLAQGQYRYTIYDQISPTNLNPALSNSIVENGLGTMPSTEVCFVTYEDEKKNFELAVYETDTSEIEAGFAAEVFGPNDPVYDGGGSGSTYENELEGGTANG